jgi:predicted O-linked N-acetylglucosamine transferase (SPINDLY family)
MVLTSGLFAAHERARFEVFGYALNPDDGSTARKRAEREFDLFRDLSALDDESALARVRADGLDVVVELNGYSDGARPRILAARACALQFSYLGHSHSLFAPWIDYRITDEVCEPDTWGAALVEQRVFVPASYYCYGSAPPVPPHPPDRGSLGLPHTALVLAALGRVEKIDPSVFGCWLELLKSLPDAVLWLGPMSPRAAHNLRSRAVAAGIAAARLVAAPRVSHPLHLARLAAADLYLDTWVFNAHTTALDALHAGLPVVSLKGQSWSARIGASLLTAAGLPELIASTPEAYAQIVVELAHDRARRVALRQRLAATLAVHGPFAPARLARHLEIAYATAVERRRGGLAAQPIVVR